MWYDSEHKGKGYRDRVTPETLRAAFQRQKDLFHHMLQEVKGSYGTRRECRVLYSHAIHLDFTNIAPLPNRSPLLQSTSSDGSHMPLYVVQTTDIKKLIWLSVTRFSLALEILAQSRVGTGPDNELCFGLAEQVESTYTGQVLQRLLEISSSSSIPKRLTWLWKREIRRTIRKRGRPSTDLPWP